MPGTPTSNFTRVRSGYGGEPYQLATVDLGGVYSDWTPAVSQGATPTQSASNSRYVRLGQHVWGVGSVTIGSGTTGTAANIVLATLPVDMSATYMAQQIVGHGIIYDVSTGVFWSALAIPYNVGSNPNLIQFIRIHEAGVGVLGNSGFTAALANTDVVTYQFDYESA